MKLQITQNKHIPIPNFDNKFNYLIILVQKKILVTNREKPDISIIE